MGWGILFQLDEVFGLGASDMGGCLRCVCVRVVVNTGVCRSNVQDVPTAAGDSSRCSCLRCSLQRAERVSIRTAIFDFLHQWWTTYQICWSCQVRANSTSANFDFGQFTRCSTSATRGRHNSNTRPGRHNSSTRPGSHSSNPRHGRHNSNTRRSWPTLANFSVSEF